MTFSTHRLRAALKTIVPKSRNRLRENYHTRNVSRIGTSCRRAFSCSLKYFKGIVASSADLQKRDFVETKKFSQSTRVRLIWPMQNHTDLMPDILDELNELTRKAFLGRALGVDFIAQQLKQTKFLDLYVANRTGQLCQYIRLDCYDNIQTKPVSMGIFKAPGYVCEVRDAFGETMLRELSDRRTENNRNPSVTHVNCAFSPRGYEICKTIADRIVPDVVSIYHSVEVCVDKNKHKFTEQQKGQFERRRHSTRGVLQGLKMRSFVQTIEERGKNSTVSEFSPVTNDVYAIIDDNIARQIHQAHHDNPSLEKITEAYIKKMKDCTGLDLPFLPEKSLLKGCIPTPKSLISSMDAHDERITDVFHALLDIPNGDMFLFYSEVSYEELTKKIKNRARSWQ